MQEPAQPDTLAPAQFADAVHPVVPVAGAHQRQAMRADSEAGVESARAVLEEAGDGIADRGLEIGIVFGRAKLCAFDERRLLVQH